MIAWSGDLHSIRYVTRDSLLIIQFPTALLAIMGELNRLLPKLSRVNYVRFDAQNPINQRMVATIGAIESSMDCHIAFSEVLVYAELLRLFADIGQLCLSDELSRRTAETNTDIENMKLMEEACLYISENCTRPLTLSEVAAKVGVSKSHFALLFKSYTNMTFVDFLTAERIRLSESCFTNRQLHIIDIAFESGFSSISSFNRAFRKVKGCSPTQFRATMIE